MQIELRTRQLQVTDELRAHVSRRLQFSLGRIAQRILRVTVQLSDVNGPKGGDDKVCRIEVRLEPTGTVTVWETDGELRAAVDKAAERVARAVFRNLERSRDVAREPVSLDALEPLPPDEDASGEGAQLSESAPLPAARRASGRSHR